MRGKSTTPPARGKSLDLPRTEDAEAGALACALTDPSCVASVAILPPETFNELNFRAVHRAIFELHRAERVVDSVTIADALRLAGTLDDIGGIPFLAALADRAISTANLPEYLRILGQRLAARAAIQAADELKQAVASRPDDLDGILSAAVQSLEYGRRCLPSGNTLPPARAWLDIRPSPEEAADAVLVGPGNWLTRGSGLFIVGPTGCGKSTMDATLAFSFAIGRDALGFHPTRPLKSLVVQAEDDDLDLCDMAGGIVSALAPTDAERQQMRENVILVTERAVTGERFLNLAAALLREHRPDLLHFNPVSAFFGNDLNDQQEVARFFRNGLNPLLAEYRAACIPVHHVTKPSKDKDGWKDGALAYLGAGSADLANWAREVLTLRQTAPGLYELTATKRWRKLGWTDSDGKPTGTRLVAHGTNGRMVWRDATADVLEELGSKPYTAAALQALVPTEGMDKAELVRSVEESFTVSNRTARQYVADACRIRKHVMDGNTVRCALLKQVERPRREVYPGSPGNRAVVWVNKTQEGEQ